MTEINSKFESDKLRSAFYWSSCCSVFLANFLLFCYVNDRSIDIFNIFSNPFSKLLLPIIILIGTMLIPTQIKDHIAHCKFKNPLPGTEAFSKWAKIDSRISLEVLKRKYGKLPNKKSKDQNTFWYNNIYKKVKFQNSVFISQKRYILFRDLSVLQFLWTIIGLVVSIIFSFKFYIAIIYIVFYFIFALVANNSGIRFVQNAMAEAQ